MDFYSYLQEHGLMFLLRQVDYTPVSFSVEEDVIAYFDELRECASPKIFLYGDYDVDGAMFLMSTISFLKKLGLTYDVYHYTKRTHTLDREAVRQCIQNGYTHFIIGDTASSDLETLEMLREYGIKLLVIDHHETMLSYKDFKKADIVLVNSTLENLHLAKNEFATSAGALAYLVYDMYLSRKGLPLLETAAAYALISLYADCMDMSNEINRSIYFRAVTLPSEKLPNKVLYFMNEYQVFCARFIQFWYAPRINALFRSEQFDVLNLYLFGNLPVVEKIHLIEKINSLYEDNREMVMMISDLVDVVELDHFVLCNLASAKEKYAGFTRLKNYTGLVANKLASRFGKTAVVYAMDQEENCYKGSVRDPYGRNYLKIFQQLCFAGGHKPAFGLKIRLFDLESFLRDVSLIDSDFHIDSVENSPIYIKHEFAVPDAGLIEDIAQYNEFTGENVPVAYVEKQLIGGMSMSKGKYYYSCKWGNDYYIQSVKNIEFGSKMLLKPTKGLRTKLKVE